MRHDNFNVTNNTVHLERTKTENADRLISISPPEMDYIMTMLGDWGIDENEDFLNIDDTLKANYDYAHALSDGLRQGNMNRFKELIDTSPIAPLSSGMLRVLRTFKQYYPHIEHTLQYPKLTNGPLEGINTSIKTLKRVAFDYRNFAHFRDRILLMTRLYQTNQKTPNSFIAS